MRVFIKSFPRKVTEYGGILSLHLFARALAKKWDTFLIDGWDEEYCKLHSIQTDTHPTFSHDDVIVHPELVLESLTSYPCANRIGLILAPLGCWAGHPSDYARLESTGIKFFANSLAMVDLIKKHGGKCVEGTDFPLHEVFDVPINDVIMHPRDIDICWMPRRGWDTISAVKDIIKKKAPGKFKAIAIDNCSVEVVRDSLLRSKVFLASSPIEGTPRPQREAMRCGCVPIGYDSEGLAYYMEDGYNCEVIEIGQYEKHADAIIRALESPDLLPDYCAKGLQTVKDAAKFEFFAEKTVEAFGKLLNAKQQGE